MRYDVLLLFIILKLKKKMFELFAVRNENNHEKEEKKALCFLSKKLCVWTDCVNYV